MGTKKQRFGMVFFLLGIAMQLDYRIQSPEGMGLWQILLSMLLMIIGGIMYTSEKDDKVKCKEGKE